MAIAASVCQRERNLYCQTCPMQPIALLLLMAKKDRCSEALRTKWFLTPNNRGLFFAPVAHILQNSKKTIT